MTRKRIEETISSELISRAVNGIVVLMGQLVNYYLLLGECNRIERTRDRDDP